MTPTRYKSLIYRKAISNMILTIKRQPEHTVIKSGTITVISCQSNNALVMFIFDKSDKTSCDVFCFLRMRNCATMPKHYKSEDLPSSVCANETVSGIYRGNFYTYHTESVEALHIGNPETINALIGSIVAKCKTLFYQAKELRALALCTKCEHADPFSAFLRKE